MLQFFLLGEHERGSRGESVWRPVGPTGFEWARQQDFSLSGLRRVP